MGIHTVLMILCQYFAGGSQLKKILALVQFMVLDSQTPETPNIPNFENIGSPGVQTPETPKTLKMLRQLGVSGVWTPGLPIPLKYGILGVSGVWESGLPYWESRSPIS